MNSSVKLTAPPIGCKTQWEEGRTLAGAPVKVARYYVKHTSKHTGFVSVCQTNKASGSADLVANARYGTAVTGFTGCSWSTSDKRLQRANAIFSQRDPSVTAKRFGVVFLLR